MNYLQRQKLLFPLLLQNGTLISMSRLMTMSMSILVRISTYQPIVFLNVELFQFLIHLSLLLFFFFLPPLLLKYESFLQFPYSSFLSSLCRYARCYSCSSPVKTSSLYWVYEVWTCSCSKVSPSITLMTMLLCYPHLVLTQLCLCESYFPSFRFSRNVKYHEPEYWKFGEDGNKYFRHATGQIYAISKDIANYISTNL